MIASTVFLAIPLMAFLTVLHTAVWPHFPILGVVPSLPFLVALAWGLLRGVTEGMVWAFIAGFFMDLFTAAPAGGLALTYMIAVLVAVLINEVLPANRFPDSYVIGCYRHDYPAVALYHLSGSIWLQHGAGH